MLQTNGAAFVAWLWASSASHHSPSSLVRRILMIEEGRKGEYDWTSCETGR
jgi:hypothetical protein